MTSPTKTGLTYVFTGDGKGKTSAALGVAMRALAHGWKVDWIAFYKELSWNVSEFSLPDLLIDEAKNRFSFHILGKGFYIPQPTDTKTLGDKTIKTASVGTSTTVFDDDTPEEHVQAAQAAIQKAHDLLEHSEPPHVLVLDEVCNALDDGLLSWETVESLLQKQNTTHLIFTGRKALPKLKELADLVSSIEKEKHPYDRGVLAVKGLDY